MNKIFNLGSINIDHVYRVPHFVRPGETLAASSYARGAGGKGFNQSIALARAGAAVCHVGATGADAGWLRSRLQDEGVDIRHLAVSDEPTGHAVIQVSDSGENSIVLHGGANRAVSPQAVRTALSAALRGEWFLCQNETSSVPEALRIAREAGLHVCFNPAPMSPDVASYPLDCVDWLIVNETEGAELSGEEEPDSIISRLRERWSRTSILLTLGAKGALCTNASEVMRIPAPHVIPVDTTAAGDTFVGYFLGTLAAGGMLSESLGMAIRAAAITVTRPGAADSIPRQSEIAGQPDS